MRTYRAMVTSNTGDSAGKKCKGHVGSSPSSDIRVEAHFNDEVPDTIAVSSVDTGSSKISLIYIT